MSEEKLFDATQPPDPNSRAKEKVMVEGRYLWVWEMEAADIMFVAERSLRPGSQAGPEMSVADSLLWRVLVSCYDSDHEGANRIFDLTTLPRIQRLRKRDWEALLLAIERVNGLDAETVPRLRDFTRAGTDGSPPS